jgi:3-oxoacyl-[acyl-carrier protein] reductase
MTVISLEGKVAFISGSTRGIGWSIAQTMAAAGATVVINGRSSSEILQARVEELQTTYGIQAYSIQADFSDAGQIRSCYSELMRRYSRLDIAINNAGVMQPALLGMISDDLMTNSFNTNSLAVIHSMQAAARLMMRHKNGSIVNIASILGVYGGAGQVVYSSTKAAVIGMTKAAAKELAPHNIRVNCIAPGFIATEMTAKQTPPAIPMGRIGNPVEVANAALFFASTLSEYITGQILGVDGGMVI